MNHTLSSNQLINLSRGASVVHKLGGQIYLDSSVLETYAELDPALGRNTAGSVLAVLAQHLRDNPGGGRDEVLSVVLNRREDDREVEVFLRLKRARRQGQECLTLTHAGDRVLE